MLLSRNIVSRRLFSSSTRFCAVPPFASGPAPPRLPEQDQKLYENLQRSSTGAFSTPGTTVVIKQHSTANETKRSRLQINQSPAAKEVNEKDLAAINARVQATGDGEELHPDIRRGVQPEFEGERNPKTGEIGGPKNEPLRWGGGVDWSYNGRVTDF